MVNGEEADMLEIIAEKLMTGEICASGTKSGSIL
jgi:hypothetical protein